MGLQMLCHISVGLIQIEPSYLVKRSHHCLPGAIAFNCKLSFNMEHHRLHLLAHLEGLFYLVKG